MYLESHTVRVKQVQMSQKVFKVCPSVSRATYQLGTDSYIELATPTPTQTSKPQNIGPIFVENVFRTY